MKTLKDYEYFRTENGVLYCGDNMEILPLITDEIDLCLTSPPYNIGNNHHTGNKKTQAYDDDIEENIYQQIQFILLKNLYDKITKNGSVIYNHKNRIKNKEQITPYMWILQTKWKVKQELVWFNGSQNFDKCRFYPVTEKIFWLSKSPETLFTNNINHNELFNWQPEGTDNRHTRAFPIKMATDLLKCFPVNIKVFDPYSGRGTVGLACEKLGIEYFDGSELDKEYFDAGVKRYKEYKRQLVLFPTTN